MVTDDLTNLFNSRYLNRSIETEILRSNRYSTSVSLIFMDVDHFKDVNDNFGHLVGSKVLVEMGELLMNLLRTIDIIARYGGDEFVIVLPQTTLHNAMLIAERIRKSIESHTFMRSEGLAPQDNRELRRRRLPGKLQVQGGAPEARRRGHVQRKTPDAKRRLCYNLKLYGTI